MDPASLHWPAIDQARHRAHARVPLWVEGIEAGSVAHAHLEALRPFATELQLSDGGVTLAVPADRRDAALARINAALRAHGLIRAWRDETYPLPDPASGRVLATFERASSRFWGTLTYGAHCTGWVAAPGGGVAGVWVAQRSFGKATDPGAFDNLVGGGVPHGQTPFETLVREGWEEAGLTPEVMRRATPGRVIELRRDIPEGLQFEHIHSFDLALHDDETPLNQDGEVHAFTLHRPDAALAIAAGTQMTADATLVTLDFALRRRLLPADQAEELTARSAPLWRP